jgi:hypothetical protein
MGVPQGGWCRRPRPARQPIAILVVVVDPDQPAAETASERRARLNQRLRQAFIEGAEEDSRRLLGRGLTAEELDRVLRHYPGDIGPRSSFRELPGRP